MFSFFINIVFPKFCLSCKKEGIYLCEDCLSLIPITQTMSQIPKNSSLSGLFCATSYENTLAKRIIHYLKYPPFLKDLATPLTNLMIAHFSLVDKPMRVNLGEKTAESQKSDYIICPIPLSKRRMRWRGFNHSEELARILADVFGAPLVCDVIEKTKNTIPQISLSRDQRSENMKGVFLVKNPEALQKKKVLLIDDVYTTGATMEEAALVLKQAGAKQVWGVVVARG